MDRLIAIIAPFSCLTCGREGQLVCTGCLETIRVAKSSSCFLCNKQTTGWRVCSTCRPKVRLRGVAVGSHYEGVVKQLVQMLKYERAVVAAGSLASLLLPIVGTLETFDAITAIPASSRRFRQRGYNQAKLIARRLAKQLRLPYVEALGRLGHSRQVGTTRTKRFAQAHEIMYARHLHQIRGQRLLVIDDVVTTGATMKEAGRALKAAGAKYVWGAAVAKH